MKKLLILLAALLFTIIGCKTETTIDSPKSIPMGTWNYSLIMNGFNIGKAVVKSEEDATHYTSTIMMNMQLGETTSVSNESIVETKSFIPVKLETYNQVVAKGIVQEMKLTAVFKSSSITLTIDGKTEHINIDRPFFLAANYFMQTLIEKKYAIGSSVEADVYLPSIELEDTITVKETVKGIEKISINGQTETLFHTVQEIEGIPVADAYIDKNGVARKMIMNILNNKLEMVITK